MGEENEELAKRVEALEAKVAAGVVTGKLTVRGAGRAAVEIAVGESGDPEIVLVDRSGRDRALLRLVDDEPALELLDGDGRPLLRAAASPASSRVVLWAGEDLARRCELRTTRDGAATFLVVDGSDAVRLAAGVVGAGDAVLRVEPARPAGEDA